jgi:hypothetical protein
MRECPYPKCGSDDREHDLWVAQNGTGPDDWSTGCACCGMTGPVMPSREDAIYAWNEYPRPAPAAPPRGATEGDEDAVMRRNDDAISDIVATAIDAMSDAAEDIREWRQLGRRWQEESPDYGRDPKCPTDAGMAASEAVIYRIAMATKGLRGLGLTD